MKKFWPLRSKATGFSLENIARKYRLNISSSSSSEISNQLLDTNNSISITNHTNKIPIANVSIKRKHWANRDFSEYK